MLRRWHGGVAHAILPKKMIEDDVVGSVGVGEVEVLPFLPFFRIHLVDQAVIAITVIDGEGRLRAGAVEERRHERRAGIVCVHGRHAEKGFEGVDHVDGGVEGVVDECLGLRKRRILADDESDAPVGIDMVGAILGIIFEDEKGGVVPERAVGNGVDDAADGEIVVGNGS